MKSLLKKYMWLGIVMGALITALGIVTVILAIASPDSIAKIVCVIIAIFLFVLGGITLLASLLTDTQEFFTGALLYGAIMIAVGVVLLLEESPAMVQTLFIYIIAIFLIAFGGVLLIKSIFSIVYKLKGLQIFAMILIAAISLTAGILALCFKDVSTKIIYIGFGVILTLSGLAQIALSIKAIKSNSKEKKQEE